MINHIPQNTVVVLWCVITHPCIPNEEILARLQSPIDFSFVCYLQKLPFWQVCWLVMFVTCQNLHFGKYVRWSCLFFGKYVRWSCLSVCLFVRKFHKISRTAWSIITKLGHKQALVDDSCKFVGQECR